MGASEFCRAALNYLTPAGGFASTPVTVTIEDARRAALPGWEVCGFERFDHTSAITDWDDEETLAEAHYAEMAELARGLTGCDHALVSSHIRRNPEQQARHSDLGPIAFVHSDFAASYGELIRRNYLEPAALARRALERAGIGPETVRDAGRLLILQFWRNTGPARMDLPIAFCDARTVQPDELRVLPVSDYAGGGFDFDALGVGAPDDPARHHWYTYPELTASEVVAFRTYDSAMVAGGEHFWTPHSAFDDPRVPPGKPSRRSIELRATCLFA